MEAEHEKTVTISIVARTGGARSTCYQNGAYTSGDEVLRDALQLWEHREELRAAETAEPKSACDEGLASGGSRQITLRCFLN